MRLRNHIATCETIDNSDCLTPVSVALVQCLSYRACICLDPTRSYSSPCALIHGTHEQLL